MVKEKKKIRFIVNPFSGVGRKGHLPELLEIHFRDTPHEWELLATEEPGHGTELAKAAADQGYEMVVAIGGDGSVNEVMAGLVGTDTVLGIIPAGSGNGFSRHIGMSLDPVIALEQLNNGKARKVDTCLLNKRPYLNLAGIGFDAQVATRLHQSGFRGFWAYLKFSLEEAVAYKAQHYEIIIDDKHIEDEFLMIEVANAPMFGYNFEIASQAKLDDGWLEVVLVESVPKWKIMLASWRLLAKSFHEAPFVRTYRAKRVQVNSMRQMAVHVDGEGYYMEGGLDFEMLPDSLWVQYPPNS